MRSIDSRCPYVHLPDNPIWLHRQGIDLATAPNSPWHACALLVGHEGEHRNELRAVALCLRYRDRYGHEDDRREAKDGRLLGPLSATFCVLPERHDGPHDFDSLFTFAPSSGCPWRQQPGALPHVHLESNCETYGCAPCVLALHHAGACRFSTSPSDTLEERLAAAERAIALLQGARHARSVPET